MGEGANNKINSKKSWRDRVMEKCEELEGVLMDGESYKTLVMKP